MVSHGEIWLVLLPCPPHHLSLDRLRAAYGPGLSQILESAAKMSSVSEKLEVDIAVAFESHPDYGYHRLQGFIGLMYRLICMICAEHHIDLEYDNDVYTRIIPFRLKLNHNDKDFAGSSGTLALEEPFGDLRTLAKTQRSWQRICSLEGEKAEEMLKLFLGFRNHASQQSISEDQVEKVPGGLSIREGQVEALLEPNDRIQQHRSVAVGGTFDHLHAGHKLLLTMAALALTFNAPQGTSLTVGITGDELLMNKQYRDQLEDFYERQSAVQHFLFGTLELISPSHVLKSTQNVRSPEPFGREVENTLASGLTIKYIEIFDPCGPTITDESIDALVLSAETRGGGQVVNDKRREKSWHPLEILEVDVLNNGEDNDTHIEDNFQSKISSTDIRRKLHQKSAGASGNLETEK